jgi:hypothetical protein
MRPEPAIDHGRCPPRRAISLGGRTTVLVASLLMGGGALGGCREGTGRLAVSGNVTLDGAPLDRGSILFTTVGEGPLVSSGGMIQEGAYLVPEEQGLLPGTYLVQISSPDTTAAMNMGANAADRPGIPLAPDRIPEPYNLQSDKQVEVTRERDNEFNFDIVTKPAK